MGQFILFLLFIACMVCLSGLVSALCSMHAVRWTVKNIQIEQARTVQVSQVIKPVISSGSGYTEELARQQQLSDEGEAAYQQRFDIQVLA